MNKNWGYSMRATYRASKPILAILMLSTALQTAIAGQSTVLVIPALEKTVPFAFDVARVKPMAILSYDTTLDVKNPLMYIWDDRARQWVKTDMAAYSAGEAFKPVPESVIVIGENAAAVDNLVAASAWCRDVTKIPTLRLAEVANRLNEKLKFSPDEWEWLSQRQGIQIKDANDEKRLGRYGKPEPEKAKESISHNPLVRWFKQKEARAIERQKKEDAERAAARAKKTGAQPDMSDLTAPPAQTPTPVETPKSEPGKEEASTLPAPKPALVPQPVVKTEPVPVPEPVKAPTVKSPADK